MKNFCVTSLSGNQTESEGYAVPFGHYDPPHLVLTFYNSTVISRTTNIQKLYMVLKLRLSVLYGLLPCTTLTDWFCVTELKIVFCAVRTKSLYKTDMLRL
jgi:hypothetical protein